MELLAFAVPVEDSRLRSYVNEVRPTPSSGLEFGWIACVDDELVGHILLEARPITPMFMGELDLLELDDAARSQVESRYEAFVLDFEVQEVYRRRGIGAALQRAAIEGGRARGLHQLRSWSSLDRPDNYRLKLRLGFAAVPSAQYIERIGKWVPGVYFVMPLKADAI